MHCIILHLPFTHLSPTASPVAYCDTERDICLHRCGKERGGEEKKGWDSGEGGEGGEGGRKSGGRGRGGQRRMRPVVKDCPKTRVRGHRRREGGHLGKAAGGGEGARIINTSWLCPSSGPTDMKYVMALGGIRHLWRLSLAFTGQSPEVYKSLLYLIY